MKPAIHRSVLLALLLTTLVGCSTSRPASDTSTDTDPLVYVVDLNDRTGDSFKVTLRVDDLGPQNAVYQFASTAPGTYQVMDIGRYVRSFTALDAEGDTIPSEQISTNQWRIADPGAVAEIRYAVAETWDTPVEEHPIYMMAGTSFEDDHAQINGQGVFGYPTGMQARPVYVRLQQPEEWTVGTALDQNASGYFVAENYDHLVDSPILTGDLTRAVVDVQGSQVEIYSYSKTDAVHAQEIMGAVRSILEGAGRYLGELPVDRYAFLFHFEDVTMGALEHSYSSTYTMEEAAFDQMIDEMIPDIVAHEFLHIVTPLNIHSEVIEQFNFVEPTPSEHVWLYEGVTEWMSHVSQLRSGQIDLETYLDRLSGKLQMNDRYDASFSLSDIGLKSYSQKGQQQWGNIYQRGAVVAALLDIKLLELSDGERGLRDVILELSEMYGPDQAFDEERFFEEFVAMTYPEIGPFFEKYVQGTEPLPLEETFAAVGVHYQPEVHTGEQVASFGDIAWAVADERLVIASLSGVPTQCGLEEGDKVLRLDGQDVTLANARTTLAPIRTAPVGEAFTVTVERDGAERSFSCSRVMTERIAHHELTADPEASPDALALRETWAGTI